MAKKLMAYVKKDLYEKIKAEPERSESSIMPVLRRWYEKCQDGFVESSPWTAAQNFLNRLENRKAFEKAVNKNGYDVDYLLYPIWRQDDVDKKCDKIKELELHINKLVYKNSVLEREVAELKMLLDKKETEKVPATTCKPVNTSDSDATQILIKNQDLMIEQLNAKISCISDDLKINNNNGGNKMESNGITQWEYKRLDYNTYNDEEIDTNMEKMGEEGWELAGTLSSSNGGGRLMFKRQKQPKQEKLSPEAAYWERMCRS